MKKTNNQILIINSSGGGIAGTLDASYYKGQGEREGIEREFVVIGKEGHAEGNRNT
jgi:hypothetical protein